MTRSALALAVAAALGGCALMPGNGPTASATLQPTRGHQAAGSARFVPRGDAVEVQVRLRGLAPNQAHGFHVHEKGDCSAPDATSAGGHFNPGDQPHGPQDGAHHAGDLPALQADGSGNAEASFLVRGLDVQAIVGRALVVHAQPDDYRTQPTGNSGARIACGVIVKG